MRGKDSLGLPTFARLLLSHQLFSEGHLEWVIFIFDSGDRGEFLVHCQSVGLPNHARSTRVLRQKLDGPRGSILLGEE